MPDAHLTPDIASVWDEPYPVDPLDLPAPITFDALGSRYYESLP